MRANRAPDPGTERAGAEKRRRSSRPLSELLPLVSGTYTIPETARRLGIGQSTAYDAIRRGDQPFGTEAEPGPVPIHTLAGQKRTFVAEVERYLSGLAGDAQTG